MNRIQNILYSFSMSMDSFLIFMVYNLATQSGVNCPGGYKNLNVCIYLSASKYINPKLIEMEGKIYKFSYSKIFSYI